MLKSLRTILAIDCRRPPRSPRLPIRRSLRNRRSRRGRCARRPPLPHGAPTLSAEATWPRIKAAEKGTPEQQAFARKVADAMDSKDFAAMKQLIAPSHLEVHRQERGFSSGPDQAAVRAPDQPEIQAEDYQAAAKHNEPVEIRDLPDEADSSDGHGFQHAGRQSRHRQPPDRPGRRSMVRGAAMSDRRRDGSVSPSCRHIRSWVTNMRRRPWRSSRTPSSRSCSR